jgi:hypothetical protein
MGVDGFSFLWEKLMDFLFGRKNAGKAREEGFLQIEDVRDLG